MRQVGPGDGRPEVLAEHPGDPRDVRRPAGHLAGGVSVGKSAGSRSPDVALMRPSVRGRAVTVVRWGSANGSARPAL